MACCYNYNGWKNTKAREWLIYQERVRALSGKIIVVKREEKSMFCFQCEQTAGCNACTGVQGVCGKKADTAQLQDELTGALIGLARATEGNEDLVNETTHQLVLESLFTTITNVNFNNDTVNVLIDKVQA